MNESDPLWHEVRRMLDESWKLFYKGDTEQASLLRIKAIKLNISATKLSKIKKDTKV